MVERERPVRSSTVFNRMMRSVLDIGRSHIDIGSPSTEHNENFSDGRKGQFQLEFGQFFNDLHDLNRLWTVRDIGGKTTSLPLVRRIFSCGAILRLTCANLRRQQRISASASPDFARIDSTMHLNDCGIRGHNRAEDGKRPPCVLRIFIVRQCATAAN